LDDRFDLLRLRAWYYFFNHDFIAALSTQLSIYGLRPTLEGVKNIGILARMLRDRRYAIDFLLDQEPIYSEYFEFYDVLAHNCGMFGDFPAARKFGTRSLGLKHDRFGTGATKPVFSPVQPFRADPACNVIAFSLFGVNPRYAQPLIASADIRQLLYPLWTLRVYVDKSVPNDLKQTLRVKGCQVVQVDNSALPGTFWRYFVADDEKIDRFLVRHADSILNIRERVAVDEWIKLNRHFHIMRDFYSHSELMLAGLWGGVRGALHSIRNLISEWQRERSSFTYNQTTIDQIFLREKIWPIAQWSALVHDSVFDFGDKIDFPSVGTLPPWKHVGQNDFIFFRQN